MLTSIQIAGLRGLSKASITDLRPVTMLVGANGSGKSTVLEATGLLCAGSDVEAAYAAVSRREWLGQAGTAYWMDKDGCKVSGAASHDGGTTQLATHVRFGPPRVEFVTLARQSRTPARVIPRSRGQEDPGRPRAPMGA
jgi:recombinational DNA repair ATPase RecF